MTEQTNKKLFILHLEALNHQIKHRIIDGDASGALSQLNELLNGVDPKDSTYERFIYHKAVALDIQGLALDAFPLFVQLFEARPYDLNYHKSFQVCVNSLNRVALEMISSNPSNEKILNLYHLITQYHYASYRVCEGAATIYAMRGQKELAKEIVANRLALSPNDLDFIGSALRIAKILGDLEWLSQLRRTLKTILQKFPFRYEVLEVEAESFEKMWAKAS